MSSPHVEQSVLDTLADADGGLTMDELVARSGEKRQDVRAAVKSLLRDDDGIYTTGVDERRRVFDRR